MFHKVIHSDLLCKTNMSDVLNFILFADETTIYCSGPNLTELVLVVEKELYKLKNWFDLNKLSLN